MVPRLFQVGKRVRASGWPRRPVTTDPRGILPARGAAREGGQQGVRRWVDQHLARAPGAPVCIPGVVLATNGEQGGTTGSATETQDQTAGWRATCSGETIPTCKRQWRSGVRTSSEISGTPLALTSPYGESGTTGATRPSVGARRVSPGIRMAVARCRRMHAQVPRLPGRARGRSGTGRSDSA